MFGFESFKNIMKKYSEENIKNVTYALWYGNTIKIILFSVIFVEFLYFIIYPLNPILYTLLYILTFCISLFYISTRKAGLAITENRVVCVIFRHLGFKEKEVHEILKKNIKAISTHKLFFYRFISISFINNTGRYAHKKLFFSSVMIGPGSQEFKINSQKIFTEIQEMQKILDRGDF